MAARAAFCADSLLSSRRNEVFLFVFLFSIQGRKHIAEPLQQTAPLYFFLGLNTGSSPSQSLAEENDITILSFDQSYFTSIQGPPFVRIKLETFSKDLGKDDY